MKPLMLLLAAILLTLTGCTATTIDASPSSVDTLPIPTDLPPAAVDVPMPPAPVVVETPAAVKTVLTLYSTPNCERCALAKKALLEHADEFILRERNDTFDHPDWVTSIGRYPVISWSIGEKRWYASGWFDYANFRKRFDKTKTPTSGMTAVDGTGQRRTGSLMMGGYPVRPVSTWWSGCGSWRHMTRGEHDGLFDPEWLRSLSWESLQSLHADHHERAVKWEYVVRPLSSHVKSARAGVRRSRLFGGLSIQFCEGCL